jgi:hypothetical protein
VADELLQLRRMLRPPFVVERLALGMERLLLTVMGDLRFETGQNRSERQPGIHGSPLRRKMPQSSGPVLRNGKKGGLLQEICRMTQNQGSLFYAKLREIRRIGGFFESTRYIFSDKLCK